MFRKKQAEAPVPESPMAITMVDGPVIYTADAAWGWWQVPTQRWAFQPDALREQLVVDLTQRIAALQGREIHIRVTSQPVDAAQWAANLAAHTPKPLPGYGRHLQKVANHLAQGSGSEKRVYLGVKLAYRSVGTRFVDSVIGRPGKILQSTVDKELSIVGEALAGDGIRATLVNPAGMEWLLRRSIELGMPTPDELSPVSEPAWEAGDLHGLTENVYHEPEWFANSVPVIGRARLAGLKRWVSVMTVGRVDEMEVVDPARVPWLAEADGLRFPHEWSIRLTVLDGQQAKASIQKKLLVARDMQKHYREHGMDEPLALERQAGRARAVEDEMSTGSAAVATRVHGHFRVAVWGETEAECLERARQLADRYRKRQVTIEHPHGQYGLMKEFWPGEPLSNTAYVRRLPALYFAAGMPMTASRLGDNRGPYVGNVQAGAHQSVFFDTHFATEVREMSGLVPIVGALGSGKSVLAGLITYEAVRRGITSVMLDPSGPLARLCYLPELRGTARHIDLTSGPSGLLNPSQVVPDPRPEDYATADALEEARQLAKQDRKGLMLDTTLMLLPSDLSSKGRTRLLVTEAVRSTQGLSGTSLWTIIDYLAAHDADGRVIADYLRDMSEMPLARLFFPVAAPDAMQIDATLTVLTMSGLVLPPNNVPRAHWSTSEQMAVPLLHLASWFASRTIYSRPRDERKLVALDEALALDTPLPTPSGWTTMGRVQAGDRLIGSDGLPVEVLGATEVMTGKDCYRVTFSDGTDMVASANHQWEVRVSGAKVVHRILTTEQMANWSSRRANGSSKTRFRVPVQRALKTPDADLPMDPYILGYWLGNGSSGQGYIACDKKDVANLLSIFTDSGEVVREREIHRDDADTAQIAFTYSRLGRPKSAPSFVTRLRDLGVLRDKHVPAAYLRGSFDQRLALLQGLMDSDGWADKATGFCTFVNARRSLVDAVLELTRSLGLTPTEIWVPDERATLGGLWKVHFTPYEVNPFRLRRKADRADMVLPRNRRNGYVTITSFERVESVPVRCVQVAATDNLFLAGRGWKVTHNCHFLGEWGAGRALFNRLGRDSRKWNTCVLAASQNPADVLGMEVSNFISAAFVGRIEDEQVAMDALRMLRVPAGVGYEGVLARLSPRAMTAERSGLREFVMRDVDGNVDRMRVDLDHLPGLLAALDTTAAPAGARLESAGAA